MRGRAVVRWGWLVVVRVQTGLVVCENSAR